VDEKKWDPESAEDFTWLSSIEVRGCMGTAHRDNLNRYARRNYALDRALAHSAVISQGIPQIACRNLHGCGGLAEEDELWSKLKIPDASGFKGHTSSIICRAVWYKASFNDEGFVATNCRDHIDSDIVGFVSQPDDEYGMHRGLQVSQNNTVFPPNTLFCLKKVHSPGDWLAPGGKRPKQRLLEVTATFRMNGLFKSGNSGATAKLCGEMITLSYASRKAYIRGLSDLLDKPLLTMQQEWSRDMTWIDHNGVEYSVQKEWTYVTSTISNADKKLTTKHKKGALFYRCRYRKSCLKQQRQVTGRVSEKY